MKERNKPTKSFIERSIEEIEKEAFREGYEAGFAKACEMLHDFAKTVYEMRKRQRVVERAMTECDDYSELTILVNSAEDWEAEVDSWIGMNYPDLMEEKYGTTRLQD